MQEEILVERWWKAGRKQEVMERCEDQATQGAFGTTLELGYVVGRLV